MVNAVSTCCFAILIEQHREWIPVFGHKLFSFEQAVDLLRSNECDGGAAFRELLER
jgi:hypothetical protein